VPRQRRRRRPVLLIVNPVAGGKPGSGPPLDEDPARLEPEALLDSLVRLRLEVSMHVVSDGEDPAAPARAAVEEARDVVVAGGDGTVSRVASALVGTDAALGILGTGSFNNIAHGYGVPLALDPALEVIARGTTATVDAGRAWSVDAEGAEQGLADEPPPDSHLFLEAAGAGLEAAGFSAAELAERRGRLAGLRAGWSALRQQRQGDIRLEIDGRQACVRAPAVTVCNGPYHGLGFVLAPDADPADGQLEVVIFAGMRPLEVIGHLLAVARGRPRREPRVRFVPARRVVIHGGRRALPVHADGSAIGLTPVAIAVQPGSLRIFR
jgi:diacylglycerol kinase family enzyme